MKAGGLTFDSDGVSSPLPQNLRVMYKVFQLAVDESYDLPPYDGWGTIRDSVSTATLQYANTDGVAGHVSKLETASITWADSDTGAASGNMCTYNNGGVTRITNRDTSAHFIAIQHYYIIA